MRHRKLTFKIGRTGEHRRSLLANLVCSLFRSQRVSTTVTKAKMAKRLAERMITLGKDGSLAARRRAISVLHNPQVVGLLFKEIAPRYATRPGGYTRLRLLGQRMGDAAEMCFLELVEDSASAVAADEKTEGAGSVAKE
jgi:large subunit ribosomal protein L17